MRIEKKNEGFSEEMKGFSEEVKMIENSAILNTDQKIDLISFVAGLKKVVYLGDHKIIESEEEEQKFKDEFSGEIKEIKRIFDNLGVSYAMAKDLTLEDDAILGFNIAAAKEKEDLDKFLKVEKEKEKDDKEMGLLLGYPKTAVEVYNSEDSLYFESFLNTELPEDERKKLGKEGVMKFLQFQPSKQHWREEIEEARKLQSLIKEKAPLLYQEIMEL